MDPLYTLDTTAILPGETGGIPNTEIVTVMEPGPGYVYYPEPPIYTAMPTVDTLPSTPSVPTWGWLLIGGLALYLMTRRS